jgi:hypothetical protein
LKQAIDRASQQLAKSRNELNALIGSVSFELLAPAR